MSTEAASEPVKFQWTDSEIDTLLGLVAQGVSPADLVERYNRVTSRPRTSGGLYQKLRELRDKGRPVPVDFISQLGRLVMEPYYEARRQKLKAADGAAPPASPAPASPAETASTPPKAEKYITALEAEKRFHINVSTVARLARVGVIRRNYTPGKYMTYSYDDLMAYAGERTGGKRLRLVAKYPSLIASSTDDAPVRLVAPVAPAVPAAPSPSALGVMTRSIENLTQAAKTLGSAPPDTNGQAAQAQVLRMQTEIETLMTRLANRSAALDEMRAERDTLRKVVCAWFANNVREQKIALSFLPFDQRMAVEEALRSK